MARSFFNLRNSLMETKSAPQGFHFTKDGKLKRGDAGVDGPGGTKLRSDPLDKQRSKIPPVAEAASSHEKNTFHYKPITGASKTSKGHTFVGITSNSEGRKGANILKHKEGGFFAASGSTSKQEGNIHKTPEAAAKAFHAKSNERLKEENTKPSNKLPMHLDPNRPFDPDIPKKNPAAKAGKYGQGFSTAKHLAKQGMASVKKEEASPMIKPPTNEFAKKEDAFAHAKKHGGKVMMKTFTHPTSGMKHVSYVVREELELDEAIKLNSKVIMHAPGKDYHGQTGTVGEIRHGLHDKADKTYTIDYGKGKSIQLQKNNIKLHKEETQDIEEAAKLSAYQKFKNSMKRAGYDMDASAKRLQDLLDKQKKEREEKEKKDMAEGAKWRKHPDAYDVDDEGNKTPRNPNSSKFGYDPLQRRADTANDAKTSKGKVSALKTSLKMAKGQKGVAEGDSGAKYKVKSIGRDNKGKYYISPSTGKKVYNSGVNKGDHENPKTGEIKKGVAETSDYFRRREREEAIISGQKPARKKQPAQTSDYARRREQEKKAKERVEEAGPFSYGAKPTRKGSVAYNALMKRKEQEKNKPPIEPKDQMVGTAKIIPSQTK